MSSAADELPSGDDPSPNTVLTGTIGYLNADGTLGTLLQGAIFGTLVSVATGGVDLIQSVFGLVVAPLDAMAAAIGEFIDATVLEPLGIISTTAETSATSIAAQFGPFALLTGVGVVLGAFWMITQFLEQEETSDTLAIPGFPDIPAIGPIDVGVTEEGEEDEN
ncbi:hypothetical protein [Halorubrum cibi]|uniref:Uncharacterized protein n=1 Tax=Halorubrum cibi TaxID=413815 RepID=A0A521F5A2_9EURY|nr:hypothetical protein [Halorubrum cibi]SMO91378.1 hypothetical protein SAMN06264867_1208 [Halorubrum cibi]